MRPSPPLLLGSNQSTSSMLARMLQCERDCPQQWGLEGKRPQRIIELLPSRKHSKAWAAQTGQLLRCVCRAAAASSSCDSGMPLAAACSNYNPSIYLNTSASSSCGSGLAATCCLRSSRLATLEAYLPCCRRLSMERICEGGGVGGEGVCGRR